MLRMQGVPKEIDELRKVRDLICFDGPLLSEYRSNDGDCYLYFWCGVEPEKLFNRWLLFRVAPRELVRYLFQRIPLRKLIKGLLGSTYLIEIYDGFRHREVCRLDKDEIPEEYLPEEGSFYDYEQSGVEIDEYAVLLDGQWDISDLSDIPKEYIRAFIVLRLMGSNGTDNDVTTTIKRAFTYSMDAGGYNVTAFFKTLMADIPKEERPALKSFQFSSPGYFTLRMSRSAGETITAAVKRFLSEQPNISDWYLGLHNWSLGKNNSYTIKDVRSELKTLVEHLGLLSWDKFDQIINHVFRDGNEQHAARDFTNFVKYALAYYRVLQRLAKYQIGNKISLV